MTPMKRFTVSAGIFLVFIVLLFGGIYLYFSAEPPAPPPPPTAPTQTQPETPSLGLDDIAVTRPDQIPFNAPVSDDAETGERDDRVYTVPLTETRDEVIEHKENVPRLVRLFKGPTAGYRTEKKNDVWEVQVVEQGRGNRYRIQAIPYTLAITARGEFTRVTEGYPFSDGNVLVLYESADNETVIRSAFVPFSTAGTGPSVQRFEDNIRVATNNENLLFFIQMINKKAVGVVVDVSNPSKTQVVWESGFTSWLPRWGRGPRITIHTPITDFMKGFVYLIDPSGAQSNEQFVSLTSGGSAFIDTTTDYFILFETESDNFVGKTVLTNKERSFSIDLPITLPEKCDGLNGIFVCGVPKSIPSETASGHTTLFPDSWYQGDISFDDVIIKVNAATGEKKLLLSPDAYETKLLSNNAIFDVIHPRISADGEYFFFVNKYDGSLWMLRLE